jgi:hypothetical protein
MVGTPGGKEELTLGASWRGDGSEDGKANWAAAVPGHPTVPKTRAPNTRAASMPPAP